jgi:hypothetical protein
MRHGIRCHQQLEPIQARNQVIFHITHFYDFSMKPLFTSVHGDFHPAGFTEQSSQKPCISGSGTNLNFSGFVGIKTFPENSALKSFPKQGMKGLRKHFRLKNFEEGHCHDFAHNPKFVSSEPLKRKPFQMVMIFQLPESGFDALPLMIKLVKRPGGKLQIRCDAVPVGAHLPSAVFFLPADSADNHNPSLHAVFQRDLSEITDGNTFRQTDNPGGSFPGQCFKEVYPVFHNAESGGSSDGIPEGKLCQKKQVPKRHICAVGPDNINGKTERYRSLNGLPKKILRIGEARKQFRIDENFSDKSRRKLKAGLPFVFLIVSGFGTLFFRRGRPKGGDIDVRNHLSVRIQKVRTADFYHARLNQSQFPRSHGSGYFSDGFRCSVGSVQSAVRRKTTSYFGIKLTVMILIFDAHDLPKYHRSEQSQGIGNAEETEYPKQICVDYGVIFGKNMKGVDDNRQNSLKIMHFYILSAKFAQPEKSSVFIRRSVFAGFYKYIT